MATITSHGLARRGSVSLDFDVPASLFAAEEFAPVRDLRSAFDSAQHDAEAAYDAYDEAKEAKGVRKAAIVRAVREGKKPPAELSDTEAEARIKIATETVTSALRAAKRAADAYEAALVARRPAIRAAMAPDLRAADEEATEAERMAAEKKAQRSMILAAYNALDNAAALADDLAAGERTHRHRRALTEARSKSTDGVAAFLSGVDHLESGEYAAARRGQANYEAALGARAELQAIRNGERRFLTMAERAQAEAVLVAQLRGLGIQA